MNVLSEQVESQANKITHLESMLATTKSQLTATEQLFQQAVMTRSSLENTKFDLLSELSKLRVEMSTAEQAKVGSDEKLRKAETEITLMKTIILEKETEISALRLQLAKIARTTGYALSDNELALLRSKTDYASLSRNVIWI